MGLVHVSVGPDFESGIACGIWCCQCQLWDVDVGSWSKESGACNWNRKALAVGGWGKEEQNWGFFRFKGDTKICRWLHHSLQKKLGDDPSREPGRKRKCPFENKNTRENPTQSHPYLEKKEIPCTCFFFHPFEIVLLLFVCISLRPWRTIIQRILL